MQFKHPEILYFLLLGIIPIIVHLFQLQKFVKIPFTNVAFLQKLQQQTRKSSRIKKWLILTCRILALFAIVFAFTQPYFSNKKLTKNNNIFIYLDNSLSMDSNGEKGNLLQTAIQEIIENTSNKNEYSLLTNTNFYANLSKSTLKDELLNIKPSTKKTDFKSILLKINEKQKNKTNTLYKKILISDFQNFKKEKIDNENGDFEFVFLQPETNTNISIDSVFIDNNSTKNLHLNIVIKNQGKAKNNVPIAVYNKEKLISKQTFSVKENDKKEVVFPIQKSTFFSGKIQITFNDTFKFDNQFYFTINTNEKINVLAIGHNNNFLSKIYTNDEFNFTNSSLKNLNYNSIASQKLIILNEVKEFPQSLINTLSNYAKNGGRILIVPNKDSNITSYNLLIKNIAKGQVFPVKKDSLKITSINFYHPVLKNVFEKKAHNFQHPFTTYFFSSSFNNSSNIISFINNKGFFKQVGANLFFVASPLNKTVSNFTNSPLIVPVFYNIGKQSFQSSKLYYTIGYKNAIDVSTTIGKDAVLSVKNNTYSFIPLQKNSQNKVRLFIEDKPDIAGIYTINDKSKTYSNIAFNNPKKESLLSYLNIEELTKFNKNITSSTSVKATLEKINNENKVHWLWKWFLILAIVSLFLEILILKFFKI